MTPKELADEICQQIVDTYHEAVTYSLYETIIHSLVLIRNTARIELLEEIANKKT